MVRLEELANAALGSDALRLRGLAQDWLLENPVLSRVARPESNDADVLATAAGLVELLALRAGQSPPGWTAQFGPVKHPVFLVKAALTMRRLRQTCEAEPPLPLRRRGLYAPADFLSFA
jgi:hypothetical protein